LRKISLVSTYTINMLFLHTYVQLLKLLSSILIFFMIAIFNIMLALWNEFFHHTTYKIRNYITLEKLNLYQL
jgi:hypothetical protein